MTRQPAIANDDDLRRARAERWLTRVDSMAEAGAYVDRHGFALLFPAEAVTAPCLWEAVAGEDVRPFDDGMGTDEARVWEWKDELPNAGLCWYGKFLYRRASLLSQDVLAALYPGRGRPTDHRDLELSREAHEIMEALQGGPLPTAALRQIVGDKGRCDRAVAELHRQVLVTSAGVERTRSGWPTSVLDLTCRAFNVGGSADPAHVTARFLATLLVTSPRELALALGWAVPEARRRLDALVGSGAAVRLRPDEYAATG